MLEYNIELLLNKGSIEIDGRMCEVKRATREGTTGGINHHTIINNNALPDYANPNSNNFSFFSNNNINTNTNTNHHPLHTMNAVSSFTNNLNSTGFSNGSNNNINGITNTSISSGPMMNGHVPSQNNNNNNNNLMNGQFVTNGTIFPTNNGSIDNNTNNSLSHRSLNLPSAAPNSSFATTTPMNQIISTHNHVVPSPSTASPYFPNNNNNNNNNGINSNNLPSVSPLSPSALGSNFNSYSSSFNSSPLGQSSLSSSSVSSSYQSNISNNNNSNNNKDVAWRKIFVGGLHYGTDVTGLRNYFSMFGRIASAEVLYNRETTRSRGFGFVIFQEDDGQNAVDRVLNFGTYHTIEGKTVEIKRAVPKAANNMGNVSPTLQFYNNLMNSNDYASFAALAPLNGNNNNYNNNSNGNGNPVNNLTNNFNSLSLGNDSNSNLSSSHPQSYMNNPQGWSLPNNSNNFPSSTNNIIPSNNGSNYNGSLINSLSNNNSNISNNNRNTNYSVFLNNNSSIMNHAKADNFIGILSDTRSVADSFNPHSLGSQHTNNSFNNQQSLGFTSSSTLPNVTQGIDTVSLSSSTTNTNNETGDSLSILPVINGLDPNRLRTVSGTSESFIISSGASVVTGRSRGQTADSIISSNQNTLNKMPTMTPNGFDSYNNNNNTNTNRGLSNLNNIFSSNEINYNPHLHSQAFNQARLQELQGQINSNVTG